jgi:hypothetical protein
VLDPADQCLVGRIVLVYHRGAVLAAIVHYDIDLVPPEARLCTGFLDRGRHRHSLRRLRRGQKIVGVFLYVLLDRIEMLNDFRKVAIAGAKLIHHQRYRRASGITIELANRLPVLALPLRHLLHDCFELALRLLKVVLDVFALCLRQRIEQLGCEHLAVAPRGQRQPHGRAQHGDTLLLSTPLQLAKGLLVAALELLINDVAPCSVVVAFDGRRQGGTQLLDESFHRLAKPIAASGR